MPESLFSLLLKSVFPGMGRKVSNCFVFGIYVTDVPKLYNLVFRVGGQSIGVSASASFLPMKTQD